MSRNETESFLNLTKDLRKKRGLVTGEVRERYEPPPPLLDSNKRVAHRIQSQEQAVVLTREGSMNSHQLPLLDLVNLSTSSSFSTHLPAHPPPAPTDNLMLSAGEVRERYRELRKTDEKKINDRHGRILRKHTELIKKSSSTKKSSERADDSLIPLPSERLEEVKDILDEPLYPFNFVIISDLIYAKFCTDLAYKNQILSSIRRNLLQGCHVILRSGSAPTQHESTPSDDLMRTVFGDERLRESKQILRSLYVSCAALTSQDIPPPIEERVHRSGAKVYEIVLIPKAKMTNGHGT